MSAQVIRGEDAKLQYDLVDENGQPFPLAGLTGVSGEFPLEAGGWIYIAGVVVSSDCGVITVDLSDTVTSQLRIGEGQKIQITLDFGTIRRKAQFEEALDVYEDLTQLS